MDKISELKTIIEGFLPGNKARLDCLARALLALFTVKTVNLKEMAVAFVSKAKMSSRHKRLKRFFAEFKVETALLARWVFQLFFAECPKVYLTIDRTNWFIGKAKINILVIAIAYEGLAIPVVWKFLNKAGNASAKEHIALLRRWVGILGKEHILGVLGDREFASGCLFKWCHRRKIPFYIRIKEDSMMRIKGRTLKKAKKFFSDLEPKTKKVFPMAIELYGEKVFLAGSRSERGELMIVATTESPKNAISIYLRRWEIESLFQGLKTRGFRLEDTRLTHLERIENLMVLLTIGFCWAHKVGEWRAIKRPIIFNTYQKSVNNSRRPEYSYFRYGFDWIRELILQTHYAAKDFKICVKQIFLPNFDLQEVLA